MGISNMNIVTIKYEYMNIKSTNRAKIEQKKSEGLNIGSILSSIQK